VDVQIQLERSASKCRKLDAEITGCRAQRKETSSEIRAYRKIAKDVEDAKLNLIARQEANAAVCDPINGLPSILANFKRRLIQSILRLQ
jgi:Tfp pilus assembly major pilin PilA